VGFAGGCPAATYFLCLAKESKQRKARPLQRPSASHFCTWLCGGQKNSLRSNSFCPKPRKAKRKSGAVEGWSQRARRTLNRKNHWPKKLEYAISMRVFGHKWLEMPMDISCYPLDLYAEAASTALMLPTTRIGCTLLVISGFLYV
jgi:hypothetical protein